MNGGALDQSGQFAGYRRTFGTRRESQQGVALLRGGHRTCGPEGVVRVRRTLVRSGGRISLGEPKTRRSRRTVHLTGAAVEALRSHLERQLEYMGRLGDLYRDHELVFTSEAGTLINPTNLRRRSFAPLLQRTGLPQIRFHDLRHTCATLLLVRNVHPKYVQELLGHTTVAITLDTYSHVIPGMGDHTARAMEDVFS